MLQTIGCSERLLLHFYWTRLPANHNNFKEQVAQDTASLAAGKFTGLDALIYQNAIDNYHRNSPFGINVLSAQKLCSEFQGRRMRFSPAVLEGAERVFDQAALQAAIDLRDLSSAKIMAFKAMNT